MNKKPIKNNVNVKKLIVLLVIILMTWGVQAKPASMAIDSSEFEQKLEVLLPKIMDEYFVPGVAVALIQNGEVSYQSGFGHSDLSRNKRVNTSTGFNVGSISKSIAAWGVMRLVEQGKLSLDAPVEKYLKRWHLPTSKFDISGVTIRRLLSHTAGLPARYYPGWGENDTLPTLEELLSSQKSRSGAVRLIMEPGTKYKYSGSGYTLCQLLIEEITGQHFEDYMRDQILLPLGMRNSSYILTPEILSASSLGYDRWGQPTPIPRFTATAAAGLHTTIEDMSHFVIAAIKGASKTTLERSILSPDTIRKMLTPAPATKGTFGLGYTVQKSWESMVSHGHRGANRGWHAYFNFVPKTGNGIVVMTNGTNGSYIDSQIVCIWTQWTNNSFTDKECNNTKPIAVEIYRTIKDKGIGAAIEQYHQLKVLSPEDYEFDEGQLNSLGYGLLSQNKNEDAVKILQLNAAIFPTSENAFDSLAEAYLQSDQKQLAIKSYKNVLKLNPENGQAQYMLKKLTN